MGDNIDPLNMRQGMGRRPHCLEYMSLRARGTRAATSVPLLLRIRR